MGNRGLALAGVGVPSINTVTQSFSGSEAQAATSKYI